MLELTEDRLEDLKAQIPIEIGKRVKFFRMERGLTQTQLAQAVGKDRQYLYKIEKGIVTPNVVTISILAMALEISLEEFFKIKL